MAPSPPAREVMSGFRKESLYLAFQVGLACLVAQAVLTLLFAKVLPHDVKARKEFVSAGAIQRLQDIDAEPGSKLKEYVDTINSCYPEEIVRYYSPGYSDTLMEKIDNYSLPGGN